MDELARIEVVNLDAWAASFLRSRGFRYRVLFEEDENEFWDNAPNALLPTSPTPRSSTALSGNT